MDGSAHVVASPTPVRNRGDADISSSAGQQGRLGTFVGRWELKAVKFKQDANKLQDPEENKYAYEEFRFAWDLFDEGLKAAMGFDPQNATDEQEKMLDQILQRKWFLIQTAKGDRKFFKVIKNALSVPGATCDDALSALALHFGADALAELFVTGFVLLSFMKDPETEPIKRMMKAKELNARVHGTAWKPGGFLELLVVMFGLEEKHQEMMIRKVSEWFEKNKTLPTLSNIQAEFEALSTAQKVAAGRKEEKSAPLHHEYGAAATGQRGSRGKGPSKREFNAGGQRVKREPCWKCGFLGLYDQDQCPLTEEEMEIKRERDAMFFKELMQKRKNGSVSHSSSKTSTSQRETVNAAAVRVSLQQGSRFRADSFETNDSDLPF
uniref:Uncharacterized protein n=1 Tax=Chromera velia CCMP2878 TaxID=1169474 RepID=A0A0G4GES0_9ALVE|eukprot:Cvel_21540.t1-p1 / transcript=Cvel_21540.t1 / gene=Cvel_21540 / organism=Chromera_velia_CCMP2878 / gene_product=hypothetical protein / transcript_product=hypothetical protein / location=Cvel_scaffold2030:9091-10227(-) / protein_length=379 / sequence_SO=supercontig / SO=protein_coding / is_pseudo=false